MKRADFTKLINDYLELSQKSKLERLGNPGDSYTFKLTSGKLEINVSLNF